jgi:hypothetical protein
MWQAEQLERAVDSPGVKTGALSFVAPSLFLARTIVLYVKHCVDDLLLDRIWKADGVKEKMPPSPLSI